MPTFLTCFSEALIYASLEKNLAVKQENFLLGWGVSTVGNLIDSIERSRLTS